MERRATDKAVLNRGNRGVGLTEPGFQTRPNFGRGDDVGVAVDFNDEAFTSVAESYDVEVRVFAGQRRHSVHFLSEAPGPCGHRTKGSIR